MKENTHDDKLIERNTIDSSNDEIPIKEEPIKENDRSKSITSRKTKLTKEDHIIIKRKKIFMYIVLLVYLLISVLCVFVENNFFAEDLNNKFDTNKTITAIIFISSIAGSFLISLLICYLDCLIKTHFFGILFLLILNVCNDYSIIYGIYILKDFSDFFSSLVVLASGSIGLLVITVILKNNQAKIWYLFLFNGLFSAGAVFILYYIIYNDFWTLAFCSGSFIISEFNTYSSQYKFKIVNENGKKVTKKELKETLIYSQPFELNISVYKFFALLVTYIIKLFKCCFKNCKKNKGNNSGSDKISNVGNSDTSQTNN